MGSKKEKNIIAWQLATLRNVAKDYPTSSIPNAIQQLESRLKHIESKE